MLDSGCILDADKSFLNDQVLQPYDMLFLHGQEKPYNRKSKFNLLPLSPKANI